MQLHLLLLDEGFMSGAYTAIGLRDAGCRITIIAGTGGHGHYDGRNIDWSLAPAINSREYLCAIDGLVRRSTYDYVLPLTEPIQALLWDAAPSWSDRIFPPTAKWQRELLRDKRRLAEFAATRGIAVPEHRALPCDDALDTAIASLGKPLVVKGSTGRGGSTTHIVHSLPAAREAMARVRRTGAACFAQRYVAPPTYLAGGIFVAGCPLRLYAGIKVAQHPRLTGPATMMRSLRDERLLNAATTAMRALEWTGIASIDFVRDAAGRYLLLEVNPRPWGSIAAASAAGVDFFAPLAAVLRGEQPVPELGYRAGVECGVFPLALLAAQSWRSPRALRGALRGFRSDRGIWRPWRQARHLVHRLARVAHNW
jgi:hypothetical protein